MSSKDTTRTTATSHDVAPALALAAVVVALIAAVVLTMATTAHAATTNYDAYACTLQGRVGLTYIVEASSSATITSVCPPLEKALNQTQLRWGLHSPSFSSGEVARLTWVRRVSQMKVTILTDDAKYANALIKILNNVFPSSRGWTHNGISYP